MGMWALSGVEASARVSVKIGITRVNQKWSVSWLKKVMRLLTSAQRKKSRRALVVVWSTLALSLNNSAAGWDSRFFHHRVAMMEYLLPPT